MAKARETLRRVHLGCDRTNVATRTNKARRSGFPGLLVFARGIASPKQMRILVATGLKTRTIKAIQLP